MKVFEAIRRMFTLPARYNSIDDIWGDPAGALDHAARNARTVAAYMISAGLKDDANRLIQAAGVLEQVAGRLR